MSKNKDYEIDQINIESEEQTGKNFRYATERDISGIEVSISNERLKEAGMLKTKKMKKGRHTLTYLDLED